MVNISMSERLAGLNTFCHKTIYLLSPLFPCAPMQTHVDSLKPIFHQNAKYLASGTFASPNAKNSTSASPTQGYQHVGIFCVR